VPILERPVVAATLKVTEPGPRPVGGLIVSQFTLLEAVHGQVAVVVTAIVPVPPAGGTARDAGAIANAHPSDWVTLNFCPAIVMMALRGGSVDGGTSNETVPVPCPLALRSWIQSASADADHPHIELEARTGTWPLPPP
jgi:hypothetical protein